MWGKKHPCGLLPLSCIPPDSGLSPHIPPDSGLSPHWETQASLAYSQSPYSSPFRLSPCSQPRPSSQISKVPASACTHCLHRWVNISGRRVQGGHTDHLCKVSPICLPHTDCCAFPPRHISSSWFQAGFPTSAGASQGAGTLPLSHFPPWSTGHILIASFPPYPLTPRPFVL